jgi:hypothetical protein
MKLKLLLVLFISFISFNIKANCELTDNQYILSYKIKNEIYDIEAKLKFRCNSVRFEIIKDNSKRNDWISCDILEKNYNISNFENSAEWKEKNYFQNTDKLDYILKKEWNSTIEFKSGESKGKYFILPLKNKNHEIYCINEYNEKELTDYRPFKLEPTILYIN